MRRINNEVLWNICKDKSKEKYGLLYEEKNAEDICNQYADKFSDINLLTKVTVKDSVRRKDLINLLNDSELVLDNIENVNEGVYFIPTVFNSSEVEDKLINDLKEVFDCNIVVSTEKLRSMLKISLAESDFFVSKLCEKDLINKILDTGAGIEYFAIGNAFKADVDTNPFTNALSKYIRGGLITKANLDESTEINLTEGIIAYFENENLLCKMNRKANRYLLVPEKDEFAESFMLEISAQIQDLVKGNNFAVTEPLMKTFCLERLNELYDLNDESISNDVVDYVLNSVSNHLGLVKQGKNNNIFVEPNGLRSSVIDKKIQEIKNIPDSIIKEIKIGGDGRAKLNDYIVERVSNMSFNVDKNVDEYIKDELITVSEEMLINKILPSAI